MSTLKLSTSQVEVNSLDQRNAHKTSACLRNCRTRTAHSARVNDFQCKYLQFLHFYYFEIFTANFVMS